MKSVFKLLFHVFFVLFLLLSYFNINAQNSMVGDGFGGRLWYKPYNYTVGSYSGYTICGNEKQLYGWGGNTYGQLGDGTLNHSTKAVKVMGMSNVNYYSTGYVMGAIKTDSSGWIWGKAFVASDSDAIPNKVIDQVKFVDAGMFNCAFVKNDGTVWSVGTNENGEFGDGNISQPFSRTPSKMLGIQHAVRTAQGLQTTCALLKNGEVWVAGKNAYGGLGNGAIDNTIAHTPIKVSGLPFIVDIKSTMYATIALDSTGNVWFWGFLIFSGNAEKTPFKIPELKDIVAISGCNDGQHFMALDNQKNAYAWGNAIASGGGNYVTPTIVMTDVNDIMAGETFSYLVKKDGTLWCAGFSNGGSIWLNLSNNLDSSFLQLDPTVEGVGLCPTSNEGVSIIKPPSIIKALYFPNAFSPNGNGQNDIFKAICIDPSLIESYSLIVMNRWGQTIFRTTNINEGWKAEGYSLDVYYYYCNYKQYRYKVSQEVKGDLTLVR